MRKMPQDIIVQLDGSGRWILYNVFTRDTLAVTVDALRLLEAVSGGASEDEINRRFSGVMFSVWEIGIFSNTEGLLADPTGRIRNHAAWPPAEQWGASEMAKKFEDHHFLIRDDAEYGKLFEQKTSLLDSRHRGNFHEQLGRHLLIEKRTDPVDWWVAQKFTPDYQELRDTLYKTIQGEFLDSLFRERFRAHHSIIDLGCGTGYYAKRMGKTGASVLGIDPCEKYIRIAEKEPSETVSFRVSEIGIPGSLDWISSASADFVFMSDALLFYFVSPNPAHQQDIAALLSDIGRILKPGGRFFSIEPHGVFWLAPWLGEEGRPFTVMTEYRKKKFGVTPNYAEMFKALLNAGFVIRNMEELYRVRELAQDRRASSFSEEYPLWWFFELEYER